MPDERPLTAEQRERIEAIRAELLRIERYTVTWPGGRALKRIPEMLPDDVGYDVRFVQMLRLMHRLLDAVGSSVYEYRNDYDRYIDSPEWSRLSRETIAARGSRCERCGACRADGTLAPGLVLVVHHKTYERVGHELPEDLEVLCEPCHRREHGLPELPVHAATIPATPKEGGESRGGAGTVTARTTTYRPNKEAQCTAWRLLTTPKRVRSKQVRSRASCSGNPRSSRSCTWR